MIDITNKSDTLRMAVAQAQLSLRAESISAIRNKKVPKGDVFASAKIAGLFAVKNTSNVLPHCHPIPIEFANINFKIKNKSIIEILVEVKTIYKTGCEMEALHGASVAALTIYDMLKPIDKSIEIQSIKLLKKSGGKSDNRSYYNELNLSSSVIVISDSVFNKKSKDESGIFIKQKLKSFGIKVNTFEVIPDETKIIQDKIKKAVSKNINLIITTGGTGFSKRDFTYESVKPLIEKEITGVMESARIYGQRRTPYAMLSKGIAGFIDDTLVMTFPGSLKGVTDYIDSLFPYVLHLFKIRNEFRH